jgi:centromere protein C
LAQNDLNDAAVVPGIHKEIEEKDNDRPKRRTTFFRKLYTPKDDKDFHQEGAVVFSAEEDSELIRGLSASIRGKSSNRFKKTRLSKSRHYSRKSSGVVENAQDIADDKNNVESSSDNEIVHVNKRAIRSQEEKTSDMEHNEVTDLRRSKRHRVKPLEYWRGERIKYKTGADRCREVEGIDPGFPSCQRIHREHRVLNAKKILQSVEGDSKEPDSRKLVSVPYGNGMRELECFSTFRIDSDVAKCMEGNCDVYTALKVPGMSTGYVEIGPLCESCSVIHSNLVFCIVVGELTVTIHETAMKLGKGEIFFVPKGVSHLLRNDGEGKSVLAFTKYDD